MQKNITMKKIRLIKHILAKTIGAYHCLSLITGG